MPIDATLHTRCSGPRTTHTCRSGARFLRLSWHRCGVDQTHLSRRIRSETSRWTSLRSWRIFRRHRARLAWVLSTDQSARSLLNDHCLPPQLSSAQYTSWLLPCDEQSHGLVVCVQCSGGGRLLWHSGQLPITSGLTSCSLAILVVFPI